MWDGVEVDPPIGRVFPEHRMRRGALEEDMYLVKGLVDVHGS